MIARAVARFVKISPRKVRYVIDPLRRKSVPEAQAILSGAPRRASEIVRKLLNQAVDAAAKNSHVEAQHLFVSRIMADGGPAMKRFRAASMGRAAMFRRRTSHIFLELDLLKGAKTGETPPPAKASPTAKAKKVLQKKLVGAK